MTRRLSSTRTALMVLAVLSSGLPAVAQVARSQFNGTVSDTAGGVLVGATVVATNVETNVASTATTTDAGIYVIPYLPSGTYRINVTAAGFRPAVANDVSLRAAQTLTIDFQMNVDAITEELTVAAPLTTRVLRGSYNWPKRTGRPSASAPSTVPERGSPV